MRNYFWLVAQESAAGSVGLLVKCPRNVQVSRGGVLVTVPKLFRLNVGDRLTVPPLAVVELVHTPSGKLYRLLAGQSAVVAPNGVWLTPKPVAGGARKPLVLAHVVRTQVPAALPAVSRNASQTLLGVLSRSLGLEKPLRQPLPFGAVAPEGDVKLTWGNTLTPEQIGTQKLVLSLRRDGEREPFLAEALPSSATTFTVSASKLDEGQLYLWEVAVGRQKIEGRLWLLRPAEQASATAARRAAADATKAAPREPVPFLVLAEQLRALGLFSEALAALKEAQRRDPTNALTKAAIEELERVLPL